MDFGLLDIGLGSAPGEVVGRRSRYEVIHDLVAELYLLDRDWYCYIQTEFGVIASDYRSWYQTGWR